MAGSISLRHAHQLIKSLAKAPEIPTCSITEAYAGETCRASSVFRRDNPCFAGRKPEIMRNLKMSKPVVLITGALTGIGRAAAFAFARKGANVVVSGRRDEAGHTLVSELHAL